MKRYLILGAGHFGYLALSRLAQQEPGSYFTVVDQNPESLMDCRLPGLSNLRLEHDEGVDFLISHLRDDSTYDWIIPAIPCHVAFEWVWRQRPPASGWQLIPVPPEVEKLAVWVFRGQQGEVLLSLADFICPDDCPEPDDQCRVTGLPRVGTLYEALEDLVLPGFESLVVHSEQLAPGVGGYPPADLWQLWDQVQAASGKLLIATACRCHGVVHGLSKQG
ncbi:MAG: hypothetical protein JRI57_07685 [Deltaproteobacteria bacterium]|nr:hypothetical protein [Deltaproteobacteria bacterium]MBW1952742.1 hypothetical protein [Deltaproteobacteria bacterium]MBW1986375.1 hypothetical protein [Deltaproteobacteria bacterium]MBW2133768.1 hypothetical protein [Deltaproteobacteria bacterium]